MVVVSLIQITQLGLALTLLWSVFVMAFQRETKTHKKNNNLIKNETNEEENLFLANGAIKRKPLITSISK